MAKRKRIGRDSCGAFIRASKDIFNDIRLGAVMYDYGLGAGWIYIRTLGLIANNDKEKLHIRDEEQLAKIASEIGCNSIRLLRIWQDLSTVGLIKLERFDNTGMATISLPVF